MINSKKRRLPGWLLLVGITIGLGACGGEDTEPGTSSSGTASSSSSSSSGGSVFVPPEEPADETGVRAARVDGVAVRCAGGCPAAIDRAAFAVLEQAGEQLPGRRFVRTHVAFRRLRELAAEYGLPEVSMGMSHDFEAAIEEGATMVRIGTALFGER